MAGDEGGLLGDLPRQRPGTRSARRAGRPERRHSEPWEAARPRRRTAGEAATEPLRLAVGAVETGLRVASSITGGLIRRLPRI